MYRRRNDQAIRASIAWGVLGLRTAWRDMAVCILRTEIVAASIGATTSAVCCGRGFSCNPSRAIASQLSERLLQHSQVFAARSTNRPLRPRDTRGHENPNQ
jgi:hypothetical protein